MRPIDADALIKEHCDGCNYLENGICDHDVCGAVELMKEAPTLFAAVVTTSCEDPNTEYITFPDGLRLIIRGGEYVGWYVCK
jgi:hypothetical protein